MFERNGSAERCGPIPPLVESAFIVVVAGFLAFAPNDCIKALGTKRVVENTRPSSS